jgi:hypothetical protein
VGSDQWSPIGEGDEKVVLSQCSLLLVVLVPVKGSDRDGGVKLVGRREANMGSQLCCLPSDHMAPSFTVSIHHRPICGT